MSKHTPGPWNTQYKTPTLEDCPEFFIMCAGGYIATVDSCRDENAQNARLIAAAPDLLEALERLLQYGAMTGPDWPVQLAEEAIAKARDES